MIEQVKFSFMLSAEQGVEVHVFIPNSYIPEKETIDPVLAWTEKEIEVIFVEIAAAKWDESLLKSTAKKMDNVEDEINAVLTILKRLAEENKVFVSKHQSDSPESVKTRLVHYRNILQEFFNNINQLWKASSALRDAQQSALNVEVLVVSPQADVGSLTTGRLSVQEMMQQADSSACGSQDMEEFKRRVADIQKVDFRKEKLFDLMKNMSVLMNRNQAAISKVEGTMQEANPIAETATRKLEDIHEDEAMFLGKRACITASILILAIAGIITITVTSTK